MSGENQSKTLIQGTAILAAAALISKIIGVLYRIPYQNITGDTGLAVYEQVYPIYMILLTLATAGIPVAISKMVSERLSVGDTYGARKIFQVAALSLTGTGIFFFIVLFVLAPFIAELMSDVRLTLPIRAVAFALLVVPVMASIRGYYQGHQNMIPTGISQVVEQVVRVGTILLLSYILYHHFGPYHAGAGAVFGAFTGALAALGVLLFFWRRVVSLDVQQELKDDKRDEDFTTAEMQQPTRKGKQDGNYIDETWTDEQTDTYQHKSFGFILKKVAAYAIPISLGSLVIPLFQLIDSLSIPNLLAFMGWPQEVAMDSRGLFARGQPLVQFGAFFATAMALALVPSISEAQAKQNHSLIQHRTQLSLKLTFIVGVAAALGLSVLADPVNNMLYVDKEGPIINFIPDYGTQAISVLAFMIIFSTLSITSGAILQGLGHVFIPARHLFIGVIVKAIGNVTLIPVWDITGAALASVIGYAVAAGLNLWFIYRITPVQWLKVFAPTAVLSALLMVGFVWLSKEGLLILLPHYLAEGRLLFTIVSLVSVFVGMIVYGLCLLRLGVVGRGELQTIPRVSRFVPLLEKLKIIKDR